MAKKKQVIKYDPKTVVKFVNDILENNDWRDGYEFHGNGTFFLKNISVKNFPSKKAIKLLFTIEYRTKTRRVINNVTWNYNYKNIILLQNDMNSLQNDIISKTGDVGDVFGTRFNEKLFVEREYANKGWIIKR